MPLFSTDRVVFVLLSLEVFVVNYYFMFPFLFPFLFFLEQAKAASKPKEAPASRKRAKT